MKICRHYDSGACRSCSLLSYAGEAETFPAFAQKLGDLKEGAFREGAAQVLGSGAPVQPLFRPKNIIGSRSKLKAAVAGTVENPSAGLIDENFCGIDLPDCPLHLPLLNELLDAARRLIGSYRLFPYDIAARRGELKNIIIMCNRLQSEAAIRFVLRSREALPRVKKAVRELMLNFPQVKAASVNLQPLPAAILEGPEEILISENKFIREDYGCCRVALQPGSFMQVTPETAAALYAYVSGKIAAAGAASVLDLFCGAGAFLLASAPHIVEGTGFEISESAVDSARHAAAEQQIKNLSFERIDLENSAAPAGMKPDAVIVNPPRRGLGEVSLSAVTALNPAHIIYSSCNPVTLYRDLLLLRPRYELVELKPFDMFPMTEHLEAVAVLRAC